jgi:hypothetical protein
MQNHCWVGGTDGKRKTLFGQQQVLVFKEKEEWLLVQLDPQEGVSSPTAKADLG